MPKRPSMERQPMEWPPGSEDGRLERESYDTETNQFGTSSKRD